MLATESFQGNAYPTIGVEVELQLVDASSMALRSAIDAILDDLPAGLADSVKPEFMQCYVEINTDVCRTIDDVRLDLSAKIQAVERIADRHGVRLAWAATHPFSTWHEQEITPNERYYRLADLLQETVVRPVTYGLHVHIGVESGDKALQVGDRLVRYLPVLLALSANSPFWDGRLTGHHAHRIELLEGFPTGGLPPRLQTWDEFLALLNRLKAARFVDSSHELWWDVRPNAKNGTVEVRICDMPPDLSDLLGLTALIQCLVKSLSDDIDRQVEMPAWDPLFIRQNRWRACRYGLSASLVDPVTLQPEPARKAAEGLAMKLADTADALECSKYLDHVLDMASRYTGAEQQIASFQQSGDLVEVVRGGVARSRLTSDVSRNTSMHGWDPAGLDGLRVESYRNFSSSSRSS